MTPAAGPWFAGLYLIIFLPVWLIGFVVGVFGTMVVVGWEFGHGIVRTVFPKGWHVVGSVSEVEGP